MKKIILTLIASSISLAGHTSATESPKEEQLGFWGGLAAGAAAGGPPGAIIGGVFGAWTGDKVHRVEIGEKRLASLHVRESELRRKVARAEQQLDEARTRLRQQVASVLAEQGNVDLLFATGSAVLSDAARERLEKLAFWLKQSPELALRLDGYADPRGSEDDNWKLSQQRIEAVRRVLLDHGVTPSQITVAAHGERLSPTDAVTEWGIFRRVSLSFQPAGDRSEMAANR